MLKFTKNSTIDLEKCEEDLLLNKKLTNTFISNTYELLFDCDIFNDIFNIVLSELKIITNKKFDVYVKNMWGFINDENEDEVINFNHDFKNGVNLNPQFSFIYFIKSEKTTIHLKSLKDKIELNSGDILIFKTDDFIKEEPINKERMMIIGSISLIENMTKIQKVLF